MSVLNENGSPGDVDLTISQGGPVYRMIQRLRPFRRLHYSLQAVFWVGITWLPLFTLSMLQGTSWGNRVRIPLLSDLSVFGRFCVALPLLVCAEFVVDSFMRRALSTFNSSGIISAGDLPIFHAKLGMIARLHDSAVIEIVLAVLAFVPFYLLFADYEWGANGLSSWHGTTSQGLTAAGWWFACVSSPTVRFFLFRGLWRFTLWCYLMTTICRLNLILLPTHPDRLGGLAFLLRAQQQFGLLAAAMASIIAGQFGNEIIHFGKTFNGIRATAAVFVACALVAVLAPLTSFSFKLFATRYEGLQRNNGVARSVAETFDAKWSRGSGPDPATMIGTQDPSSLIDYISAYDVIREMSVIPIDKQAVIYVASLAAAPFASLWLLNKPLERLIAEIIKRLLE